MNFMAVNAHYSNALDACTIILFSVGKCLGAGCQVRVVAHFYVVHGALPAYPVQQGFGPFAGLDVTFAIGLILKVIQRCSMITRHF